VVEVDDDFETSLLPSLLAASAWAAPDRPRTPGGDTLSLRMEALERRSYGSWPGARGRNAGVAGDGAAATLRAAFTSPADAQGGFYFFATVFATAADEMAPRRAKGFTRDVQAALAFRRRMVAAGGAADTFSNGTFTAPVTGVYDFQCSAGDGAVGRSSMQAWLTYDRSAATRAAPLSLDGASAAPPPSAASTGGWRVTLQAGYRAACWIVSSALEAVVVRPAGSFFTGALTATAAAAASCLPLAHLPARRSLPTP